MGFRVQGYVSRFDAAAGVFVCRAGSRWEFAVSGVVETGVRAVFSIFYRLL